MRCLVTGGTGFVGRSVVRALRARGMDVLLFARPSSDTREALGLGCRIFTGDLQDFAAVKNAVAQAEALIHVGEIGMRINQAPQKNVDLVRIMLEEAAGHPGFQRFVLVSSVTTAAPPATCPADESTPSRLILQDVYSRYKRNCENAVRSAKIPATIVRGSTIYGPGAHYLVWFVRWLRRFRLIGLPFPGRIDATIPSIHVEDMAEALVSAALQTEPNATVYNGVDDAGCSVAEFTARLGRLMNTRYRVIQVPLWLQRAGAFGLDRMLGLFGKPSGARSILDYLSFDSNFSNDRLKRELAIRLKFPTIHEGLPGTAFWIAQRLSTAKG